MEDQKIEQNDPAEEWKALGVTEKPVIECAFDGSCFKLLETLPDDLELQEIVWSEVKLVTVSIVCRDKQGGPVPWTKCCWSGGPEGVMTIKRDWRMLMAGMKSALGMLKLGETAWFRVPKDGQKCEFLLRYPVEEDDIFVKISLKAVQLKVHKEPKKQDPYLDLQKILKIKEGVDKEFSKHHNIEYGLDQYTKLMHKWDGLVSATKKSEQYRDIVQEANQQIIKVRNNLGLVLLKAKRHEEALTHIDFVLTSDSGNVKAMHRKGFCLESVGCWEESLVWFKRVKDIESINRVQDKIRTRNLTIMSHLRRKGLS